LQPKKISFLTTGHNPLDDRIFYHLSRTFADHGWSVEIISSKSDLHTNIDGISLNCFSDTGIKKKEKIRILIDKLNKFNPDLVICSEPLPILAARQFSKKRRKKIRIIYDITEWYPSKKNLENTPLFLRWFIFIKLIIFNILASSMADAFIFGEWYKSRPYRILFPFKPYIFIPYYPDSKYIPAIQPELQKNKLRLSYSGKISLEKGFGNFINVVKRLANKNTDLRIEVKIIGWYNSRKDRSECEYLMTFPQTNISVTLYEKQPFQDFINLISDSDIFIDLRKKDFENERCLPIRIFYYAALGRPVIITDLKSVRREVELDKFGFAADPTDEIKIARFITNYLGNRELYLKHCGEARLLFENKYNWSSIKNRLTDFVNEISAN